VAPPALPAATRTPRPAVIAPRDASDATQHVSAPRVLSRSARAATPHIREKAATETAAKAAPHARRLGARERVVPVARPHMRVLDGQAPAPSRRRTQITTTPDAPTIMLATNITRRAEMTAALLRERSAMLKRPALATTPHAATGDPRTPTLLNTAAGRWWSYLFDNFDGDFPGYWLRTGAPTWGRTTYRAVSAPYSIWCMGSAYTAPHGYLNNMNAWILDGPFDMRNTTALEVYFDYFVYTEAVYDSLFVGVSTDGINFTGDAFSGYSAGWVLNRKVVLNEFAGAPFLYVGVQFLSDNINAGLGGAYVDNIELDAYIPSDATVDLAAERPRVLDSINEIFTFDVVNFGPGNAGANSYAINVYVDGVLDSSARNTAPLGVGEAVTWEWQLTYIYPRGPHTIRIEVLPDAGDIAPPNNVLTFIMDVGPQVPVDLLIAGVHNIDGATETFELDVVNRGPGVARAYSYAIAVDVDGVPDSETRNSFDLPAHGTVTWQWQLAYYYPPGEHVVRATIFSDTPETTTTNNTRTFVMNVPVPPLITDLRLMKPVVTDVVNDIIWFRVRNYGPDVCDVGQYLVRVFVDGWLDSQAYNSQPLVRNGRADWNWQLAYIYPAGLHVITIDVIPLGSELTPLSNVGSIHLLKKGTTLTIAAPLALTGVVNSVMAMPLTSVGGAPPCTWRIANGTLPPGVTLAGNGVVAGVPTAAGTSSFTVEARDAAGLLAFGNATLVVLPGAAGLAPQLLAQVAPAGFVNTVYAAQLTAAGGAAPYTWSSTNLPPGLTLSSAGLLSGTPLMAGDYAIGIGLTDAAAATGSGTLHLRVRPAEDFLNGNFIKVMLTVPWNKHDQGMPNSDTVKIKASFSVPPYFVLDKFLRGVLYIGGQPFNYNVPTRATWRATAMFTPGAKTAPAPYATIRWSKNNQLQVTMTVRKADLAPMLARYGITRNGASSALIPVRLVLNNADTGTRTLLFSYRLSGNTGTLRLQ
jgi:hypothetical protein